MTGAAAHMAWIFGGRRRGKMDCPPTGWDWCLVCTPTETRCKCCSAWSGPKGDVKGQPSELRSTKNGHSARDSSTTDLRRPDAHVGSNLTFVLCIDRKSQVGTPRVACVPGRSIFTRTDSTVSKSAMLINTLDKSEEGLAHSTRHFVKPEIQPSSCSISEATR